MLTINREKMNHVVGLDMPVSHFGLNLLNFADLLLQKSFPISYVQLLQYKTALHMKVRIEVHRVTKTYLRAGRAAITPLPERGAVVAGLFCLGNVLRHTAGANNESSIEVQDMSIIHTWHPVPTAI